MELRRELLLAFGLLILFQLGLAFGTVGLLVRMGPAIEEILDANDYSILATEDILTEFAHSGGQPLSAAAQSRIHRALEAAQKNVTEPEELPVLEELRRRIPAASLGPGSERQQAITTARELIAVNRRAMHRVDEEAQRLGLAGAWSAVFLGFLSFLLSLLILVRLQRRLVNPLVDLHQVLLDHRAGERMRRCQPPDAPREVVQVIESVHRLLDERLLRAGRGDAPAD